MTLHFINIECLKNTCSSASMLALFLAMSTALLFSSRWSLGEATKGLLLLQAIFAVDQCKILEQKYL